MIQNLTLMEFTEAIREYAGQPITRQIILDLLKDYKRPYDKIGELIKQGLLVHVRRGLYITGPKLNIVNSDPFLLANHLLGPSYVSLESALFYWGLIPEKTYETSSVTIQRTAIFNTSAGRFSYTHIPLPYYAFGIKQTEISQQQRILIATPEKALCDKIVTTSGIRLRSSIQVKEFLLEDLRIERILLQNLDQTIIRSWITESPKKNSLEMLLKTLKEL